MESRYNARMKRGHGRAPELTRREALRLGLAGAGLAAFPGSLMAPAFAKASAREGRGGAMSVTALRIDAHAHIFNARDIAVAGFLRKIGSNADASPLERLMRALLFFLIPDKYEDALTALLHLLAMRAAPTIKDERKALAALVERIDRENPADRRAAFFQAVAEENDHLERDVDDIVSRALTKLLKNSFTERERNQVVRFMTRLVAMRYQNAARLFELYGKEGEIALFTPAMIDLSLWLDDESSFPMMEHVELYSEIARLTGGGLLPFVAFDPWRQAFGGKKGIDRGEPLRWVREAVERYGFIGVKLYPAMGFLPMRNAAHDGVDDKNRRYWPRAARQHKNFGAGLDRALGELYEWCEANNVPVLAHTNSSMAPHRGYAKRGHPREWEKVLKIFPKLRLNLGHFGGWAGAKDADGWSRTIAKMMERYEHLYADVGAFDSIDLPKKRRKLTRGLVSLVRKHPVVAERLLYASDWYMANSPSYLADFEEVLQSPGLEKLREGFFGANAARYLGLGEGERNRARLEAHRQSASPLHSGNAGNAGNAGSAFEAIRR